MLRLALKNLLRHPVRSVLTMASLVVAMFLLCTLRSLITTMESGIANASSERFIVQSAVSLFVDLPLSYQGRIQSIPGVERVSKWHWFGGYYQDRQNQFAQFAVDPEEVRLILPELEIVGGSYDAFVANRRGIVVGDGLVSKYGWKVGDTVPLIGLIYPHPDGFDLAWEFEVEAIYHSTVSTIDANMLMFHWEYFQRTLEEGGQPTPGVGTFYVKRSPGTEETALMSAIDALYANGPQRVQTTPEAEFQAQFVTMMGNLPFLVSSIGGAVLIAILLACINTMMMAAREQIRDVGVLKALGFGDASVARLMLIQGLLLCGLGGLLGIGLAVGTQAGIAAALGAMFPGYALANSTLALALGATLGIGLLSGLLPAWSARRLKCVDALGATE